MVPKPIFHDICSNNNYSLSLKTSYIHLFLIASLATLMLYCTPKEELERMPTSGQVLRFSNDSIIFDTVFTGQLSVTRRITVYNTSENAITINEIRLAGANSSYYSLYINGLKSNMATNVFLRGNDSLLILATVTLDRTQSTLPFLVTDSLLFNIGSSQQKVYLTSWGRNADYFRGDTIKTNTVWDSTAAKFIYKSIFIAQGATLFIEKGTDVHLVKGASIVVAGSLQVSGDSGALVSFRGPRLEKSFDNIPGQWQGIVFLSGSKNNSIAFAEIKNAEIGLTLGDSAAKDGRASLNLTNTYIKNMNNSALVATNAELISWNCEISNCASYGFKLGAEGTYKCFNNTFALYSYTFRRFGEALFVTDGNRNVELVNNIIWGEGYNNNELSFKKNETDVMLKNLTLSTTKALTSDTSNFWNINPKFKSEAESDFSLDTLSPAIGKAQVLSTTFNNDIKGKTRGDKWDIGCYKYK